MNGFVDIHCHLLFQVDDGASSEQEMKQILDDAYRDGTRAVCATPHFHPGYFESDAKKIFSAFQVLEHCAKEHDGLKVYLGNELRFSPDFEEWFTQRGCRTLNGSKYLLVDFSESEEASTIINGVLKILHAGYVPVLAHVERYRNFHRDLREVLELKNMGAIIQVDAQSPFGGWSFDARFRSRKLLCGGYADIVASDAHDIKKRPPQLSQCYDYVKKKVGERYADRIFTENPLCILEDRDLERR